MWNQRAAPCLCPGLRCLPRAPVATVRNASWSQMLQKLDGEVADCQFKAEGCRKRWACSNVQLYGGETSFWRRHHCRGGWCAFSCYKAPARYSYLSLHPSVKKPFLKESRLAGRYCFAWTLSRAKPDRQPRLQENRFLEGMCGSQLSCWRFRSLFPTWLERLGPRSLGLALAPEV